MFSQGKSNDIIEELKRLENPRYIKENQTIGHDVHRKNNREKLGDEYGLDGRSVARYVRVASLIEPLKTRLNNSELTLGVSVELSYFPEAEQQMVEAVISEIEYKVDPKKAELNFLDDLNKIPAFFAINVGLVVTLQIIPKSFFFLIWSIFAVSRNNFIAISPILLISLYIQNF